MLVAKTSLGIPPAAERKEIVIPVLDALDSGKMLAGVLLRDDLCAGRMQPVVAVGMIEMPVGVDQMRDRIGAELRQCLGDLGA